MRNLIKSPQKLFIVFVIVGILVVTIGTYLTS